MTELRALSCRSNCVCGVDALPKSFEWPRLLYSIYDVPTECDLGHHQTGRPYDSKKYGFLKGNSL